MLGRVFWLFFYGLWTSVCRFYESVIGLANQHVGQLIMPSVVAYISDPCLLGEAPCCLRQWSDLWSAPWSQLPALPWGLGEWWVRWKGSDPAGPPTGLPVAVTSTSAEGESSGGGDHQVPRVMPRCGAGKSWSQVLCTGQQGRGVGGGGSPYSLSGRWVLQELGDLPGPGVTIRTLKVI